MRGIQVIWVPNSRLLYHEKNIKDSISQYRLILTGPIPDRWSCCAPTRQHPPAAVSRHHIALSDQTMPPQPDSTVLERMLFCKLAVQTHK